MIVYISGPMKCISDGNRAAFHDAELMLADRGYEPVNPHNLSPERKPGEGDSAFYERCMAIDLAALERCDAIFLLSAWQASRGALREYQRARELGIEVLHE